MEKIEYIIVTKKITNAKNDFRNIEIPFEVLGYSHDPIFFKRIFLFTKFI